MDWTKPGNGQRMEWWRAGTQRSEVRVRMQLRLYGFHFFEAILPREVGHPLTRVKVRRQEAESRRVINSETLYTNCTNLHETPDAARALPDLITTSIRGTDLPELSPQLPLSPSRAA